MLWYWLRHSHSMLCFTPGYPAPHCGAVSIICFRFLVHFQKSEVKWSG
nr:hypothetical protein 1p_00004 [Serratia proteamaculans]ULG18942.1 hypothetical protein RM5p1_00007 [Serratia proteamaculans]